jgi:hypothetical protein
MLFLHILFGLAAYPVFRYMAGRPPKSLASAALPWIIATVWLIMGVIWMVNKMPGLDLDGENIATFTAQLREAYFYGWILATVVLIVKGCFDGEKDAAAKSKTPAPAAGE